MEMMSGEEIIKLLEAQSANEYDDFVQKLILNGEEYGVLEKIIDGTIDKKFLKILIPLKKASTDWDDFCTLLEIGVMDGTLELSDIKSKKRRKKD